MLVNIDTELDRQGVTQIVTRTAVTETVTATAVPSAARAFLGKPEETWDWSDLRDYVVAEIERRFGTFPREARKEYGVFTRFLKTWGADAVRIARYVFEVEDGYWMGSPVTTSRFTKGCDPYFAEVIAQRLNTR